MAFDAVFERYLQVPNFHTKMYLTARPKDELQLLFCKVLNNLYVDYVDNQRKKEDTN